MNPEPRNRTVNDEDAGGWSSSGVQPDTDRAAKAGNREWDSILVGSSPLLLMEAAYLGRTGRKVLVLEEKKYLGGAWGHLNDNEFGCLDIGCHYIDISSRAYEFLRSNFDLNLVPTRPQPQFVYRNFRFPYDYRQVIRVSRYLRAALKQRSMVPYFSNYLQDENYRLRLFPFTKKFMYPRGGSLELMTKLAAHAARNDVTILNQRRIESIRFDRARQRVKVASAVGESFEAGEIVVGSQARVGDALHIPGAHEAALRQIFTHVNLVLRDPGAPTFSYVRFLRHPNVIRMTDITDYVRQQNESLSDFRVVCIGIREHYDQRANDAEKIEQLSALLRHYRFVDPSATCDSAFWSRYPAEFLTHETRQKMLHDFSPMIRFMPTTNLSIGIVMNLDRWEPAFAPGSVQDRDIEIAGDQAD